MKLKLPPHVAALNGGLTEVEVKAPPKFGNRHVKADGYTFDSAAEYKRYRELRLRQMAREIEALMVHPVFRLVVNDVLICNYEADFLYYIDEGDTQVVEDVKGTRTSVYVIKKRLMLACLGIAIVEIEP